MEKTESSVFRHLTGSHNPDTRDIKVSIIARDTDTVLLRLKESYFIRKERPELN
jgi:hypothetical protein